MKIKLLLLQLIIYSCAFSQEVPGKKILDQPDGITISYFNYTAPHTDKCLAELFIGDSMKFVIPCWNQQRFERKSIERSSAAIEKLKGILTFGFIDELETCCAKKGCGDTNHGYYFMIKKGDKYDSIYIDVSFISLDKCGNKDMLEVIDLYTAISSQ